MDGIKRLNLINSISGIKPANLIGTISNEGRTNLAIFSSIVHIGSNPALLGFIMRPHHEVRRDTYINILSTGVFTINLVPKSIIKKAHYTSVKFGTEISEFDRCNLKEEYLFGFKAPFVGECEIKMALNLKECVPITSNNTEVIIGEVEHLILSDDIVNESGHVDLEKANGVGISGLNSYYQLLKIAEFPYARESELPCFNKGE